MTFPRPFPRAAWMGLLLACLSLAAAGSSRAGESGEWDLTIEILRKQDATLRTRIGAFKERHAAEAQRMARDMEPLLREGARLALWQATAEDLWEIRDILAAFSRLQSDVRAMLARPEQTMTILEQDVVLLDSYRERLAETLHAGVPASFRQDMLESEKAMTVLRQELIGLRDRIAGETLPLREMATRIKSAQNRLQASLAPSWREYYGNTFQAVFSRDYLQSITEDAEDWLLWSGFLANQLKTPRNSGQGLQGLAVALITTAAAGGLLVLGSRWTRHRGSSQAARRLLRKASFWALAGVFFAVLAYQGPPFLFTICYSLSEILWTAALVHVARVYRGEGDTARPSILWPMWRLFALGLLGESLRIPESIMGPLFCLVFLIKAGVFLRKTRATPKTMRLDRAMTRSLSLVLPVLAGLSLYGLPQTAILIASALFYIALALRFAATTRDSLERLETARGRLTMTTSILRGAGFPFYFLSYFFLFLWLLSTQYGGENVFLEIAMAEARFESVGISLQKALALLAGFYATRACMAAAAAGIAGLARGRGMEHGVRSSLLTINTYFWWGCYAIFSLSVLGLSLTNLAVVAGGLSVGIGFGLQNLVNNFIGGLILLFGRSVQAGDTIQLGENLGVVKEVNIRNTEVQTLDNATVFVPNAELVSGRIINWSHKDPSARREVGVGVAYGSDTAQVRRLLLEAAAACPAVRANPAPSVLHADFGDNALQYRLRVWIDDVPGAATILSTIREEIDRRFREAGIEIAFPQTDLHLRTAPALETLAKTHLEPTQERLAAIADRLAALETLVRAATRPTNTDKKDVPHA